MGRRHLRTTYDKHTIICDYTIIKPIFGKVKKIPQTKKNLKPRFFMHIVCMNNSHHFFIIELSFCSHLKRFSCQLFKA